MRTSLNPNTYRLKLFKLSQNKNSVHYDTYDSCIVVALNAEKARYIHPSDEADDNWWILEGGDISNWDIKSWCPPEFVKVEEIGLALVTLKSGVLSASFNAG